MMLSEDQIELIPDDSSNTDFSTILFHTLNSTRGGVSAGGGGGGNISHSYSGDHDHGQSDCITEALSVLPAQIHALLEHSEEDGLYSGDGMKMCDSYIGDMVLECSHLLGTAAASQRNSFKSSSANATLPSNDNYLAHPPGDMDSYYFLQLNFSESNNKIAELMRASTRSKIKKNKTYDHNKLMKIRFIENEVSAKYDLSLLFDDFRRYWLFIKAVKAAHSNKLASFTTTCFIRAGGDTVGGGFSSFMKGSSELTQVVCTIKDSKLFCSATVTGVTNYTYTFTTNSKNASPLRVLELSNVLGLRLNSNFSPCSELLSIDVVDIDLGMFADSQITNTLGLQTTPPLDTSSSRNAPNRVLYLAANVLKMRHEGGIETLNEDVLRTPDVLIPLGSVGCSVNDIQFNKLGLFVPKSALQVVNVSVVSAPEMFPAPPPTIYGQLHLSMSTFISPTSIAYSTSVHHDITLSIPDTQKRIRVIIYNVQDIVCITTNSLPNPYLTLGNAL